jgi:hypothetical protein
MPIYEESVIKNYSGLSSETKPTIAAGTAVPNGSRWREVDTGLAYHFNLADDAWYLDESESKVVRMEYSGDNLIYRGINKAHKAATSSATWVVYKYTYTGTDLTMIEGPLIGTWDGRASLDWA